MKTLLCTIVAVGLLAGGWLGCGGKSTREDFNEGVSLYEQGSPAQAASRLEKAAEADPDEPELWHALALAPCAEGRQEQALESYRRAEQLDPGNPRCQDGGTFS